MNSELLADPAPEGLNVARWVIYAIDEQRYALPLSDVERVVPMVQITPLTEAREDVVGVINLHGRIVPVLDCRKRFQHRLRGAELSDQLLIACIAQRIMALWVDRVEGVIESAMGEIVPAAEILPGMEAQGAMKLPDGGIVLLPDFDRCVLWAEEKPHGLAMNSP